MAASAPKRLPPTHFLCIPLVTTASRPQLSRSLGEFRDDITDTNSFAIPAGAVRPLGTLHLTLGVMNLKEEGRLEEATALLKGLKLGEILQESGRAAKERADRAAAAAVVTAEATSHEPLGGGEGQQGEGLQTMHKPTQATVLYAVPEDGRGQLYPFCDKVRTAFIDAGLMVDEGRALLLHATVVNTIYAGAGRRGRRKALSLDARGILDRYEDFKWMDGQPVESIAICKMGAKRVEEDGEAYESVAEVYF
ncbi:unnamed protein product [Parascedosporium putredinis]|uniref:A-kinase anchor protein 7-like phosphoesterase domain-containing protein n=1 Tax=Parascedosporium putredinis TaxID=1442378 RepID=A0A9P1MBI2_9PEZI|nr:unnamed protein product [Parascedosporium putredinis]CAI7999614.1 unnamed protein product [Parascedosporium putredinis]